MVDNGLLFWDVRDHIDTEQLRGLVRVSEMPCDRDVDEANCTACRAKHLIEGQGLTLARRVLADLGRRPAAREERT